MLFFMTFFALPEEKSPFSVIPELFVLPQIGSEFSSEPVYFSEIREFSKFFFIFFVFLFAYRGKKCYIARIFICNIIERITAGG